MKHGFMLAAGAAILMTPLASAHAEGRADMEWMVFPTTEVHVFDHVTRRHGAPAAYDFQAIPDEEDPGWQLASDPATVGHSARSVLCDADVACRGAVNYTYFQTWLDVPAGGIDHLRIAAEDLDDGFNVTVFNSLHPEGVSPRGAMMRGRPAYFMEVTADLASALAPGETNRIVLTQVDDCCASSMLTSVQVGIGPDAERLVKAQLDSRREGFGADR